eukprot:COSAG01_NODE_26342_length_717_cov_0.747573_1_plen_28_part_10
MSTHLRLLLLLPHEALQSVHALLAVPVI